MDKKLWLLLFLAVVLLAILNWQSEAPNSASARLQSTTTGSPRVEALLDSLEVTCTESRDVVYRMADYAADDLGWTVEKMLRQTNTAVSSLREERIQTECSGIMATIAVMTKNE